MPRTRLIRAVLLPVLVVALVASASPSSARHDAGDLSTSPHVGEVTGDRRQATTAPAARGVWPLWPRPTVVTGFDPPHVRWGAGHRGVDLAGHVGQPVRAALDGTVTFVGRVAGRGVVVIGHEPTRTTYQPVLATVGRGDRVAAGDVVGRLTGSGSHCAPRACLHWGLRRGDTYLDPLTLVDAPRPVRLLPW